MSPPPVVAALFDMLPPAGSVWRSEDRHRWLVAFGAVLNLAYPDQPAIPTTEPPVSDVNWRTGEPGDPEPSLTCEECGLVCKSPQGLAGHKAMHRRDRERAPAPVSAPEPVTAPVDDPPAPPPPRNDFQSSDRFQRARDAAAAAAYNDVAGTL